MRYPHTVTIETPTYVDDGMGGKEVFSWSTVYSGKADVQDTQSLKVLRDAGLEAQQLVTVFLPETEDLSVISKRDRLTWNSAEGLIHELSRLDNAFIASLDG